MAEQAIIHSHQRIAITTLSMVVTDDSPVLFADLGDHVAIGVGVAKSVLGGRGIIWSNDEAVLPVLDDRSAVFGGDHETAGGQRLEHHTGRTFGERRKQEDVRLAQARGQLAPCDSADDIDARIVEETRVAGAHPSSVGPTSCSVQGMSSSCARASAR